MVHSHKAIEKAIEKGTVTEISVSWSQQSLLPLLTAIARVEAPFRECDVFEWPVGLSEGGPWSLRRPQSFPLCLLCLVCAYDGKCLSYTGRVLTLKSQVSILLPPIVKSSECNSQLRAQEWTHLEGCVGSTREVMACTYTNMIYLLLFMVHLFPAYFLHLKVPWWNHNSLWSGLLSPWKW